MSDDNGKFGITITADTKDASKKLDDLNKKGQKTSETLNQNNTINVETKDTNQKLKDIDKNLDSITKKFNTVFSLGKLGIFYESLKKFTEAINQVAENIVSLTNTAQGLMIPSNSLKAWETSFKSIGFDAKTADATLGSIQDRITNQLLHPSVQVASAFAMMGVNLRKSNGELRTSEDVLLDLQKRFKQLSPEYAIAYGGDLGISREVVMAMRNNPNFGDTLLKAKAQQTLTPQQTKEAQLLVDQEAKLSLSIDQLKNNAFLPLISIMAHGVIPLLTSLVKFFDSNIAQELSKGANFISNPSFSNAKQFATSVISNTNPGREAKALYNFGKSIIASPRNAKPFTKDEMDVLKQLTPQQREQAYIESGGHNLDTGNGAIGMFQVRPHWFKRALTRAGDSKANWNNDQLTSWLKIPANNYIAYKLMMTQDLQDNKGNLIGALREYSGNSYNEAMINRIVNAQSQNMPSAQESSAINNSVNNNRTSNVESSTHIGTINVSANSPEQFANSLRDNMGYLDKALNMNGLIA